MSDYRESHLGRGADYDAALHLEPFDNYMAKREDALLRRIAAKYFRGKIPRYLDFACGTGRITALMETYAAEAYAVDVSPSMVAIARGKCARTSFHLADITRSNIELPEMDLITAFRFFGNAQQELRSEVLRNLASRLAPRGYLVFNNHRNPSSLLGVLSRMAGDAEPLDFLPRQYARAPARERPRTGAHIRHRRLDLSTQARDE